MTERMVLPHEHIFCKCRSSDRSIAVRFIKDQMEVLAKYGVTDVVDLTTYTNPLAYGELLDDLPLTVHSCVGFYLERYVSKVHRSLPVEELVNVLERRRRRLSSRLPPLAIKVAAHGAVLSPLERRTFGAAARFHLRTGLPIVTHSPRGCDAHLDYLLDFGIRGEAIMLSHPEMSTKGRNPLSEDVALTAMVACLDRGSYLCITDLTSLSSRADVTRLRLLRRLVDAGYARQVVVSSDSSWKIHVGRASVRNGSAGMGYGLIMDIHEKLRRAGISNKELHLIVSENPIRFFGLCSRVGSSISKMGSDLQS